MGLFVYTQKGSIISMVDLPTTEIIEPFFYKNEYLKHVFKKRTDLSALLLPSHLLLDFLHFGVAAVQLHELVVGALFDDLAGI